jgi:hypothetical protein
VNLWEFGGLIEKSVKWRRKCFGGEGRDWCWPVPVYQRAQLGQMLELGLLKFCDGEGSLSLGVKSLEVVWASEVFVFG